MPKSRRALMPALHNGSELPAGAAVQATLQRVLEGATVNASYGQPNKHAQHLLIPAAEIFATVGMGIGSGSRESSNGDPASGGSGGGGGAWVFARPVSVMVMGPDGVHQDSVVDITKIALAALTAFGFMASMLVRMLRARRS